MDMNELAQAMEPDSAVYKTLLESTRAIPWKIDWATMRFSYVGPQIEDLLGWPQASWQSIDDWVARMHPDDRDAVVAFCVSQSKSGVDHEADYRAQTRAGDYVWIRDVVHVVRRENGEVDALIGFMFDITERKRTEEELMRLKAQLEEYSFKDGLTGVANRRMFDSVLETEWLKARQSGQPLSLILLDIDHFKQYNDLYGHLQGDECLRQVGRLLGASALRSRDLLARFGGEEFVLILPETDAAAAAVVAERCRQQIQAARIPHAASGANGHVSISLGTGTIHPGADSDHLAFIASIDRKLYAAKQQGRNRVVAE